MLVLAVLLCLAIVAAIVLATRGGETPSDGPRAGAPEHGERGARAVEHDPVLERDPTPASTAERAGEGGRPQPAALDFSGRGAVRGELVPAPGVALPERWTLVLEPSPFLQGRERAASRRVEFEHGERSFEVLDLPLAGYRVRAEATALNGAGVDVLLVASSPAAFVTLPLSKAGLVDGMVKSNDGRPVQGFPVTLEDRAKRARTTVETDVNGAYLLRDVVDGEYALHFGSPEAPLATRELVFRAPSLRVPEEVLPALGAMSFSVIEQDGVPAANASIAGSTSSGGAFELVADHEGRARARFLRPGTWRVEARSGPQSTGVVTIEVPADVDVPVELRCAQ